MSRYCQIPGAAVHPTTDAHAIHPATFHCPTAGHRLTTPVVVTVHPLYPF